MKVFRFILIEKSGKFHCTEDDNTNSCRRVVSAAPAAVEFVSFCPSIQVGEPFGTVFDIMLSSVWGIVYFVQGIPEPLDG